MESVKSHIPVKHSTNNQEEIIRILRDEQGFLSIGQIAKTSYFMDRGMVDAAMKTLVSKNEVRRVKDAEGRWVYGLPKRADSSMVAQGS